MPYEAQLIVEPKTWPPYIRNTFSGKVTTEEVIASINVTLNLLDKQDRPTDLVAIFEDGCSLFNAKGILFQKDLIEQLTWHSNLDQIIAADLNQVLNGSFLQTLLQAAMNQPALKVSIFGSMEELNAYMKKKYENYKPTPTAA